MTMRAVRARPAEKRSNTMSKWQNAGVLAAVVVLLVVSTAQAVIINVDIANCPGPGDGSRRRDCLRCTRPRPYAGGFSDPTARQCRPASKSWHRTDAATCRPMGFTG